MPQRRRPDPPGFFGQFDGSGIDPGEDRRYTCGKGRLSGAAGPVHDGFPAAELGQRRPGEAHRNTAAAFGAGGPPCGGEGTAGHRLLPAAGQRAGGGIFSQPGPGGGGRGKGVRTGELRHLCEAGQARVGGGYHHLPRSGKMRIGQRGRSHEKGPPAGGHTAIHIREKQLWMRRR